MIQIFLSLLLLALAGYALAQQSNARLVSRTLAVAVAIALFLVWRPDDANRLAHLFGVGRGADLLLYCFVVCTLTVNFHLHLRLRAMQRDIAQLAREQAIANAQKPRDMPH